MIVLGNEESIISNDLINIKTLCNRVVDAMLTRLPSVLDLNSAVHLYHLIVALSSYTNDYTKSVNLCDKFLSRKWFAHTGAAERGGEANTLLNELLKGLFRNANLETLKKHIGKTLTDVDGLVNGKEQNLKSYPNFNK